MNSSQLILAFTELATSIVICTVILFFTFRIVQKAILSRVKIADNNIAFGIFLGSILFSVGYLVSASLTPLSTTYGILSKQYDSIGPLLGNMCLYLVLFVSISWLLAMATTFVATWLYMLMTVKIQELEEISRNNIAIAIVTSSIILAIAVFIRDQVSFLLEAFIPYPDLPHFQY